MQGVRDFGADEMLIEVFVMTLHDDERTLDNNPPSDLGAFSITKFAAMFSLSRGMVYKLRNEGKLRLAKIDNKTVVLVPEARRFQRALESDAT
jgi:hypothetical protein